MRHGLVAAALAVALAVSTTGVPASASADGGGAKKLIDLTVAIINLVKSRGSSPEAIRELLVAAIDAVTTAKNDVIDHIDEQQAALAKGRARGASIEFMDFDAIAADPELLMEWTFKVAQYGHDAKAQLPVVNKRAADQLGAAIVILYNTAMTGADRAGLRRSYNLIVAEFIGAMQTISTDLAPVCTSWVMPDPWPVENTIVKCTAANGEEATSTQSYDWVRNEWLVPEVDVEALKKQAAVNSSWATAVRILPDLRALPPQ
jgi:hypothetical protein